MTHLFCAKKPCPCFLQRSNHRQDIAKEIKQARWDLANAPKSRKLLKGST
jgi:hypothetical protein